MPTYCCRRLFTLLKVSSVGSEGVRRGGREGGRRGEREEGREGRIGVTGGVSTQHEDYCNMESIVKVYQ